MKRTALYMAATLIAAASVFSSCDNKPDLWAPETASLCGEWVCCMYQDGNLIDDEVSVMTYNTASNDNHIWVDETSGYFDLFFKHSQLCEASIKDLTFGGEVVTNGCIYKNAVKVWPPVLEAGPITVDSICFDVTFPHSDEFELEGTVQIQGHRFTGWE